MEDQKVYIFHLMHHGKTFCQDGEKRIKLMTKDIKLVNCPTCSKAEVDSIEEAREEVMPTISLKGYDIVKPTEPEALPKPYVGPDPMSVPPVGQVKRRGRPKGSKNKPKV